MKRIMVFGISVFMLTSAVCAQTVVPLNRKGEVYSFDSRLNGRQVATIISSYSRNFIPLELALSMFADSLLTREDFIGFPEKGFSPERIVPGVLLNLREVSIGEKSIKNVRAYITGNNTPFFALGQMELNKLGPVLFSDGTMTMDDKSITVAFNEPPAIVPVTDSVIVESDTDSLPGASFYKKALSYRDSGNLKEMERYLKKAIALADGKERLEMQAILVDYYKTAGSALDFEKATLQYLKDYCAMKKIRLSDCWTEGKEDAVIADHLLGLGKLFEQRDDFRKLYTYYYYSAAWGNETAQQYCQNVSMEYWKEPLNELSL